MERSAKPAPESPRPARLAARLSPRERVGSVVLGALVTAWLATLPRPAGPDKRPPSFHHGPNICSPATLVPLRLAALQRQVPAFQPDRNLFTFASLPAEPDPARETDREPETSEAPVICCEPPPPPAEPSPGVDFLGVFGPRHLRIAVLKEPAAGTVANVLEHDLVQDQFRVLEIGRQSVQLRHTTFPGAAPIRLGFPERP